jgi:FkbM family methyltransferase
LRIFDYYTDLCIYINQSFNLSDGVIFWILPPYPDNIQKAINGFYLEVYLEDRTIVKNILVKDFDYKYKLSKKFKLIKDTEVKFNEFSDFNDLSMYSIFDFDITKIRNFVDVGSCYGMAAVSFIERDIKTYLIEADADNTKIIKRMWDSNSLIKIIDKAITTSDGTVDFWITPGQGSVVSSLYEIDANGNSIQRSKITVESITPNTLVESYIDEEFIDLMKVDIEGAEYDFFETITDNNLKKIKRFIIEFHNNDGIKAMSIIKKLTKNNFKFKLSKWTDKCGDYVIQNKMGIIYAERIV